MVYPLLRTLGKVLLIAFLLFHMFAVGVYSIPREAKDVFAVWSRMDLLPIVTPYMYATSQWQIWNIFAPDPLRRVTSYRILQEEGNSWKELEMIRPDAYSFFRHATQMKMLGNLLNDQSDTSAPYGGRFLELKCADHRVPSGTRVRLLFQTYLLPQLTQPESAAWWDNWSPAVTESIGYTITCP